MITVPFSNDLDKLAIQYNLPNITDYIVQSNDDGSAGVLNIPFNFTNNIDYSGYQQQLGQPKQNKKQDINEIEGSDSKGNNDESIRMFNEFYFPKFNPEKEKLKKLSLMNNVDMSNKSKKNNLFMNVYHDGGVVTKQKSPFASVKPAEKILPDEVPAILQVGEVVVPKESNIQKLFNKNSVSNSLVKKDKNAFNVSPIKMHDGGVVQPGGAKSLDNGISKGLEGTEKSPSVIKAPAVDLSGLNNVSLGIQNFVSKMSALSSSMASVKTPVNTNTTNVANNNNNNNFSEKTKSAATNVSADKISLAGSTANGSISKSISGIGTKINQSAFTSTGSLAPAGAVNNNVINNSNVTNGIKNGVSGFTEKTVNSPVAKINDANNASGANVSEGITKGISGFTKTMSSTSLSTANTIKAASNIVNNNVSAAIGNVGTGFNQPVVSSSASLLRNGSVSAGVVNTGLTKTVGNISDNITKSASGASEKMTAVGPSSFAKITAASNMIGSGMSNAVNKVGLDTNKSASVNSELLSSRGAPIANIMSSGIFKNANSISEGIAKSASGFSGKISEVGATTANKINSTSNIVNNNISASVGNIGTGLSQSANTSSKFLAPAGLVSAGFINTAISKASGGVADSFKQNANIAGKISEAGAISSGKINIAGNTAASNVSGSLNKMSSEIVKPSSGFSGVAKGAGTFSENVKNAGTSLAGKTDGGVVNKAISVNVGQMSSGLSKASDIITGGIINSTSNFTNEIKTNSVSAANKAKNDMAGVGTTSKVLTESLGKNNMTALGMVGASKMLGGSGLTGTATVKSANADLKASTPTIQGMTSMHLPSVTGAATDTNRELIKSISDMKAMSLTPPTVTGEDKGGGGNATGPLSISVGPVNVTVHGGEGGGGGGGGDNTAAISSAIDEMGKQLGEYIMEQIDRTRSQ